MRYGIAISPSICKITSRVWDGYLCKPLKSWANLNWPALADASGLVLADKLEIIPAEVGLEEVWRHRMHIQ